MKTVPPLAPGEAMAALAAIADPEFGIGIVDLGLIYDVRITDETLTVAMTLTTRACPAGQVILDGARAALAPLAGGREIRLDLVWDPAWTPEMLSPEARDRLGWNEP